MSNRRKLRNVREARVERPVCEMCRSRRAEHALAMPGADSVPGYVMLACESCWPSLKVAAESVGATVGKCTCGGSH